MSEILAKVIRGETVESVHRGNLIILDGEGETVAQFGNPEEVTFYRSAAKPFQALPFILSGAAERFSFTESEIALACASHSGEKIHTELAEEMLEKAGLSESDLRCGSHLPFHEETAHKMIKYGEKPNQLHNNCSGKHAAMLAFAKHIGAGLESYLSKENPIQQAILLTISEFTEVPVDEIKIAVDGCSAPNFAVPLSAMALSFAKLIDPPESFVGELKIACGKMVSAYLNHPELIGGTERLDTLIMQAASGKMICKVGAEGVWLAGILPCERWEKGLSIALKIEDGDDHRARPVVAIELLRRLGVLEKSDLADHSPMPVKSRRDVIVGKVIADFELEI
jgi:L-asparaginase II